MKRTVCIWLPNWPIQRLVIARPELKSSAFALYAPQPRRGERVIACSPAAVDRGVQWGMSVSEASSLLERPAASTGLSAGQNAGLLRHEPDSDFAALESLAERCERFSPVVGLENVQQPECLLLDATGTASLFGGERRLAAAIRSDLQQAGYTLQLAIADTVGAAWGLARRGDAIVASHETRAAIASLPVSSLRIDEPTIDLLGQLGITCVGQLLGIPRASLPARLGDQLLLRLDQMTGVVRELVVAHRRPAEFAAGWSLEHPTGHRTTIEQIVQQLIEQVAADLLACDQGAVELECRLDCIDNPPARIRVGLYQPTASPQHLFSLVQMQFELLALRGAVRHVGLSAITTSALERRQQELFEDEARRHGRQLRQLVDRLSSRLGRQQVVRPRLRAGASPERAYEYETLTGGRGKSEQRDLAARSGGRGSGESRGRSSVFSRPLQLLFPPAPLQAIAAERDGPPVVFHYRQEPHKVRCYWGPERIETAWWRGPSIRRDYYRVETTAGTRFWLFRRLQDGKWFLHGVFG